MEIYKYVWQYGTRNQLKDMLSKGEISDVMYKKFIDDFALGMPTWRDGGGIKKIFMR